MIDHSHTEQLEDVIAFKQDKHLKGPEGVHNTKSNMRGSEAVVLLGFVLFRNIKTNICLPICHFYKTMSCLKIGTIFLHLNMPKKVPGIR